MNETTSRRESETASQAAEEVRWKVLEKAQDLNQHEEVRFRVIPRDYDTRPE